MTTIHDNRTNASNRDLHITFLLSAIIMTLFLCFIDEGYYDFRWMTSVGNWIVFFIYVLILFASQELLCLLFFWLHKQNPIIKSTLIISGLALGIWFCYRIFAT